MMPKTTASAGPTMFQSGGPSVSISAGQDIGGPVGYYGGGFGGATRLATTAQGYSGTTGRPWWGTGVFGATAGPPGTTLTWGAGSSSPADATDEEIWIATSDDVSGIPTGVGAALQDLAGGTADTIKQIPTFVWIAAAVAVIGAVGYRAYKKDGAKK